MHLDAYQEVSSNSLLAVPSLIGKLARDHSFRGIWAMSDAAHAIAGQTAPFEYRLLKAFSSSGSSNNLAGLESSAAPSFPCSGKYHGWFNLLANGKVMKVEEGNLMLQFTPCKEGASEGEGSGEEGAPAEGASVAVVEKYSIVGDGSNKFGKFNVRGFVTTSDGNMKLYKQYEYNSLTINKPKKAGSGSPSAAGSPRLQRSFSGEGAGALSGRPSLSINTTPGGSAGAAVGTPRESSGRIKKPSIHVLAAEATGMAEKKTPRGGSTPRSSSAEGADGAVVTVTSTTKAASKQAITSGGAAMSRSESSSSRTPRPPQIVVKCAELTRELMKHPAGVYFLTPVDHVALNIPEYPTIITQPMDLGTVKANLEKGVITTAEQFAEAVRLIFKNALTFNQLNDNPVRIAAKALSSRFEDRFRHVMSAYQSQMSQYVDPTVGNVSAGPSAGAGGAKAGSGHGKKSSAAGGASGGAAKHRASTGGIGSAAGRAASGSSANLTAPTPPASRMGAAGVGPSAYPPQRVMDETAHTLLEMQRQIKELQEDVLKLRKEVMKQEVQQLLDEKVEAAHHQMTFEEKKQLIDSIHALPAHKMTKVVEIIQAAIAANRVPGAADDDDVEIPLDDLDTYTLRQLQKFVDDDNAERKRRLMLPDDAAGGGDANPANRNGGVYQPAAKKAKRESSAAAKGGTRSPKPKPVARSASQPQTYFAGESFDAMRGTSSSSSSSNAAPAAGAYSVGGGNAWEGDDLDLDMGVGSSAVKAGESSSISNIGGTSAIPSSSGARHAYGGDEDEVDLQDGQYGEEGAGSQSMNQGGDDFVYLDAGDM